MNKFMGTPYPWRWFTSNSHNRLSSEELKAVGDLKVGYQLGHADAAILKRMAEALIAIREAQGVPVGFTSESALDDVAGGETSMFGPDRVVGIIPLFTAQQLPVVPAKIEPEDVIGLLEPTANPDEYACCVGADMWNACRDAMLSAAPKPE